MSNKQKKTVYFVRHGQSVDNASPVFQSINSSLSEKGRSQAKSIAERLSSVQFETLIASPVQRAKETAQYIAERTDKDVMFSDLFVERIKPTEIDGKPWTDAEANKIWRAWEESLYTPGLRISDGENFDDTILRVDNALAFLKDRTESTLAVVTHGYFLRQVWWEIKNLITRTSMTLWQKANMEKKVKCIWGIKLNSPPWKVIYTRCLVTESTDW